jgi:hypothetical protein
MRRWTETNGRTPQGREVIRAHSQILQRAKWVGAAPDTPVPVSAPRPIRRRERHRMVATKKLAKDDLVSRVFAKIYRAGGELKLLASFGMAKPGDPLLSSNACRETRDVHANVCRIMPSTATAPLLTESAGHLRNRLEPKAVAHVASLFPPYLFHPLLAFLQRHL